MVEHLRRLVLCWLVGLLGLLPWLAVAAPPAEAMTLRQLEDPSCALVVAEVLARGATDWQRVPDLSPNAGYSDSAWWYDLQLPPTAEAERLLEIAFPVLDLIELWVFDGEQRVLVHHRMGDKLPFAMRPVVHRHFVVPLVRTPDGRDPVRVLVRVRTTSSVQFPVQLWRPADFHDHEQLALVLQGIYLGVMLGLLVYNLFLYFSVRERVYFWYVLWVLGIATFLASINGLSFQHLWPQATQWNDTAIVFSLGGAVACAVQFLAAFLDLRARGGWMWRLCWGMGLVAFAVTALTLVLPYGVSIHLVIGMALASICMALLVSALRWREGFGPARLFLVAWSAVLLGGMVLAAYKFGWLPRNLLTQNATQIGSAIEVLLLSLALAGRLSHERHLREQAQAEVIATQRQANERLEQRVAERTQALEQLNQRLERTSRTDGLTGVFNRRHFDDCLHAEVRRSQRSGQPLGLLLVDLDHFKRVNDCFGHQAGDACLRVVADLLLQSVRRSSDVVARYGGEEFIVLLPMTDRAACLELAEAIRARIESTPVPFEAQALVLTASVGVCSRPLARDEDGAALLGEADQALYASKYGGRNRVTCAPALPER